MFRLEFRSVLLALFVVSTICFGACNNNQTAPVNSANPAQSTVATSAASPGAVRAKLNVNTASGAELMSTIPNFNNRMVHEFEEYRPYTGLEQFRREIGKYVDKAEVARLEQYIVIK